MIEAILTSYFTMIITIGHFHDVRFLCVRFPEDALGIITNIECEFDCFLINRKANAVAEEAILINAIALHTKDWVEVIGLDAEAIHDAIDIASVTLMRQRAVGDGNPMTAWHDDIVDGPEIAAYILTGGLGHAENKLVLVMGAREDEDTIIRDLEKYAVRKGGKTWIAQQVSSLKELRIGQSSDDVEKGEKRGQDSLI